ncbi:octanoyltransferase [bacterium]|nr:MAG: octanoyltransferase [bacterium]RKZ18286.1 MAG: octanoyltransferase [bacterium]
MSDAVRPACEVRRPGRVAYGDALRLQEELVAQRQRGEIDDTLLLLEHPRVLTLGRNTKTENLLLDEESLQARGYQVFSAGRGGDVTYHGPGQLVAYPVLLLEGTERDAHDYLRRLEQVLIDTLAEFDVQARQHPPHTGVWVDHEGVPKKIAAIGVRLSRWVTSHGFALNVDCDLSDFEVIVPCGISEYGVTSIAELLGQAPALPELGDRVQEHFGRVFGRRMTTFAELR